ncbi:MAG: hypothetical protein K0U98_10540 [Deltaproteobacteria bacterium]|nr:hypothetical protein [Deltaproteobacteria bacterium]
MISLERFGPYHSKWLSGIDGMRAVDSAPSEWLYTSLALAERSPRGLELDLPRTLYDKEA